MTEIDQRLGGPSEEMHVLDEAISAILYLGERLSDSSPASKTSRSEPHLDSDEAESLFRAIEGEIIPRLMLAHQSREPVAGPGSRRPLLDSDERERFLAMILRDSADASSTFVNGLLDRGVTRETIFLDLLADTARRLGELWEEDRADFTDVTIGLCRLHQVLREHSSPAIEIGQGAAAPRVLLTTACADQHVFGVVMVAEFFRRDGWRVWSEPGASRASLTSILAGERFDVLGLSAACSVEPDEVADELKSFRKASRNAEMRVLVGGRLFAESPELVSTIGADAAAFDAAAAPTTANELIARVGISC